jgi:hypothetical protein
LSQRPGSWYDRRALPGAVDQAVRVRQGASHAGHSTSPPRPGSTWCIQTDAYRRRPPLGAGENAPWHSTDSGTSGSSRKRYSDCRQGDHPAALERRPAPLGRLPRRTPKVLRGTGSHSLGRELLSRPRRAGSIGEFVTDHAAFGYLAETASPSDRSPSTGLSPRGAPSRRVARAVSTYAKGPREGPTIYPSDLVCPAIARTVSQRDGSQSSHSRPARARARQVAGQRTTSQVMTLQPDRPAGPVRAAPRPRHCRRDPVGSPVDLRSDGEHTAYT